MEENTLTNCVAMSSCLSVLYMVVFSIGNDGSSEISMVSGSAS